MMNILFKFTVLATAALAVIAAPVQPSAGARNTTATLIPVSKQVVHPQSKASIFSGRGTWFTDTVGSCGVPFDTNDMIVAMNAGQMDGYAQCGRKVKITIGGTSVVATVVDTCPAQFCSWGALDLSQAVFKQFAPLSQGVIRVTWEYIS
ncbi:hypothetical protein BGZ46_000136 [Entomortierella lignicola]|nr:hypothetical protein BGZ46_000136 [Entomortierella lignicola]KAF9206683.1 hypothetical protein BGZ49_001993 [Haplosporangium sp. Z 27]